jgi:hypothetical protein
VSAAVCVLYAERSLDVSVIGLRDVRERVFRRRVHSIIIFLPPSFSKPGYLAVFGKFLRLGEISRALRVKADFVPLKTTTQRKEAL